MRIFIIPSEPLLFRRTGRSFSAGEGGYADSLFPPTPETLQGAVRAAVAAHWDRTLTPDEVFKQQEFVDLIGSRTHYGRFRIVSIAVARREKDGTLERLFPAPAFLQKDEEKNIVRLRPEPLDDVRSNIPDGMQYLWPDGKAEGKLKSVGWLTESNLLKALRWETLTEEDTINEDVIRIFEPRLGIGMNNQKKSTEEGLLYQMRMVRMNHTIESDHVYGFVVDVRLSQSSEGTNQFIDDSQARKLLRLPEDGWITLGGERRAARFEIIDSPQSAKANRLEEARHGTMVYLATPAAFNEGWKPINWQPTQWSHPLPTPLAAAIDRYQPVGGWLLTPGTAGGTNKPIRRCVPAGSVYFFEKPVTVAQPFTDHGWQIGYGLAYAGDWKQ
jgi:CRISPR-associated protein Cmr3